LRTFYARQYVRAVDTARVREEAVAAVQRSPASGPARAPTPAELVLALQRGAGNQAVARMLSRTVTLPSGTDGAREPQSAEQVKKIVTGRVPADKLPELDAEIADMVGRDFDRDYASEQKLFSGVIDRLGSRYGRAVAQSHPRATAIATRFGGQGTLAWTVKLVEFPADFEQLIAQVEPLVEAADIQRQFNDVFAKVDAMGTRLADGAHEDWIGGKQTQLDGLVAELRVAGRMSADQLAPSEKMRFGKKFIAPSEPSKSESSSSSGASKQRPPKEVSVKADLSYTDSAGVLWFVEIAEGVEGLRKKVTRLDAHQRDAYQKVAKAQAKPTRLKYVCVDPDGWMKLCNVDKKQPSPVSVMADGGWILELGSELLSTAQLAQAAHNGVLLYGNYTADTIGRRYRNVWKSLSAFVGDDNPVSTFTAATQLQPDLKKTGESTKTDEPVTS
jgi:hypothetical protein